MNRWRWAALLCLLVPTTVGAATSGPAAAPERSSRRDCALNLIEISKQLFAFASAHGGRLPSTLSEVYAGAPIESLRALVCPAQLPRVVPGGFRPSYAYVRIVPDGPKAAKGRDDILVCDAAPAHDGGRNVLLADLETVAYMTEAELQAALAAQREKWATQGKTLEIIRDDLIPLTEPFDRLMREPGRPSLFASTYFRVAVVLFLATDAVVVLLILRRRKGREGSHQ